LSTPALQGADYSSRMANESQEEHSSLKNLLLLRKGQARVCLHIDSTTAQASLKLCNCIRSTRSVSC